MFCVQDLVLILAEMLVLPQGCRCERAGVTFAALHMIGHCVWPLDLVRRTSCLVSTLLYVEDPGRLTP